MRVGVVDLFVSAGRREGGGLEARCGGEADSGINVYVCMGFLFPVIVE